MVLGDIRVPRIREVREVEKREIGRLHCTKIRVNRHAGTIVMRCGHLGANRIFHSSRAQTITLVILTSKTVAKILSS